MKSVPEFRINPAQFFLIFFQILLFTLEINCQESPCPRLFVYEPPGQENDRWYGIVTLISDSDLTGVWLRLIFDRPSLQLGVIPIEISFRNDAIFNSDSNRIGSEKSRLKIIKITSSKIETTNC